MVTASSTPSPSPIRYRLRLLILNLVANVLLIGGLTQKETTGGMILLVVGILGTVTCIGFLARPSVAPLPPKENA